MPIYLKNKNYDFSTFLLNKNIKILLCAENSAFYIAPQINF